MPETPFQPNKFFTAISVLVVLHLKNVGRFSCAIKVSLLSLWLLGGGPVLKIRMSEQFGYSWKLFWLPWRTSQPKRPCPKILWGLLKHIQNKYPCLLSPGNIIIIPNNFGFILISSRKLFALGRVVAPGGI